MPMGLSSTPVPARRSGCAVLVTGRTPLAGLDGAPHVHLDSFDDQGGPQLLRRIVGEATVDADAAAAAEIVVAWAGLALAINLVAGRLTELPGWRLRHLATMLLAPRDSSTPVASQMPDIAVHRTDGEVTMRFHDLIRI
jgi:hypothetical protein